MTIHVSCQSKPCPETEFRYNVSLISPWLNLYLQWFVYQVQGRNKDDFACFESALEFEFSFYVNLH